MPAMNMTAYLLEGYMREHLLKSRTDQIKYGNSIGCFVSADEYASQLICFLEKKGPLASMTNKRLAKEIGRSLYLQTRQYDPIRQSKMRPMSFGYSKTWYGIHLTIC